MARSTAFVVSIYPPFHIKKPACDRPEVAPTASGDMQKLTIKVQLILQTSITLITQLQHNLHDLPCY
jgi:hypothetical protein